MYKISFVIPVYGVEDYLPTCLDSLYPQLTADCQVVLVDDASPDKCGEICEEYREKYPEYTTVIHQENMGLGGARNTGIKASDAEYLFFLDSDDTVPEGCVEYLLNAIKKHSADVFVFPFTSVSEDGQILGTFKDAPQCDVIHNTKDNKAILTGSPNACNKLFRAELFRKTEIEFPSKVWYEDIRTVTKLLTKADSIVYLEKPLYNYLVRGGSIMNNAKIDRNVEIIDAFDNIIDWFKQDGSYDTYRDELDYLVIDHVLVSATVRVLRAAGSSHPLIKQLRSYTFANCKAVKNNPYLATMPRNRKLVYKLLLAKLYFAVSLIFKIKG